MDDLSWYFVFIGAAVVLSALGTVLWWVLIFVAARRAYRATQDQFDALLLNASRELQRLQAMTPGQRRAHEGQLLRLLGQVQTNYRAMDQLHQQSYDNHISQLQGMAASAGFNWTPPA